jgi:hypothetical protein
VSGRRLVGLYYVVRAVAPWDPAGSPLTLVAMGTEGGSADVRRGPWPSLARMRRPSDARRAKRALRRRGMQRVAIFRVSVWSRR